MLMFILIPVLRRSTGIIAAHTDRYTKHDSSSITFAMRTTFPYKRAIRVTIPVPRRSTRGYTKQDASSITFAETFSEGALR